MLLSRLVLSAQEKFPMEPGKIFPYKANPQLNELLVKERQGANRKIIIDLFTSSCISCFRMLPKLQKLQDKYKHKLLIIPFGKLDKDIVKIFNRFHSQFDLSMDAIYDSSFFTTYDLPSFPRYIWLNEKGVIETISDADELNDETVERLITGLPLNGHIGFRTQVFDETQLLLTNGNGGSDTSFLFRSALTLWNKGQRNIYPTSLLSTKQKDFFQVLGVSMIDLYRYAYFGWGRWTVKDPVYGKLYPVPIFIGSDSSTQHTARYNYSFMQKVSDPDSLLLLRALRNDLATYFGYEVMISNRPMPCWKLVVTPGAAEKLKSKFTSTSYSVSYTRIDYQHVKISTVIDLLLASKKDDYPYIDLTGIDFPVDITLDAILYDRPLMLEALRKIGLDLVLSEQPMLVLFLNKRD